tara:strand:+ start:432 stop:1634 length:1203 start_codon:yes stop_codon:yes gene_type:complete
MATPYYTSTDLIESVKRKISIPISQVTFTEDDILAFANEEMMISQVPSVMVYHEEYFVATLDVPLVTGTTAYSVPERAIGGKIRDIHYKNTEDNLQEMTQVNLDDRSHFSSGQSSAGIHKYYFRGDQVVLVANDTSSLIGDLRFDYFLRPNLLVQETRVATSSSFVKDITVADASVIVAGDIFTIGSVSLIADTDFAIVSGNNTTTAANLASAINTDGTYAATPSTNIITIRYSVISTAFSTDSVVSAYTIPTTQGIEFSAALPSNLSAGSIIDFLQTRGGHRTLKMGVILPSTITTTIITFAEGTVPTDFIVGDYIASEFECIIPQIPDDLHSGLSERTCARILASLGDAEGLKMSNKKIDEIEARQGTLLDNRAEGSPQKINNRNSLLRFAKRRLNRR